MRCWLRMFSACCLPESDCDQEKEKPGGRAGGGCWLVAGGLCLDGWTGFLSPIAVYANICPFSFKKLVIFIFNSIDLLRLHCMPSCIISAVSDSYSLINGNGCLRLHGKCQKSNAYNCSIKKFSINKRIIIFVFFKKK